MGMTDEEKLLRKIQDLQSELDKNEIQINSQLDKIDGQEAEIMKYEQMFDENAPKSKIKKAKEEKLSGNSHHHNYPLVDIGNTGLLRKSIYTWSDVFIFHNTNPSTFPHILSNTCKHSPRSFGNSINHIISHP